MGESNSVIRTSRIERTTKETQVSVYINLDGSGITNINTTIPFIDHLMESFGKHSRIDMNIDAKSLDNIFHHLVEDIGITTGQAIDNSLGNRYGISRFGFASVPMDESLSEVSIDLIRRKYTKNNLHLNRESIENIPKEDLLHFLQSFLDNFNSCIHVIVKYGENDHHIIESIFKGLAVSFRMAKTLDQGVKSIPSTKGMM